MSGVGGGGGVCGCPFPSPSLLSGRSIVTLITIWCVGDEFTSLSASQVSADSCICRNWQLHRKAQRLVIVQHHALNITVVTMCICPMCTKMLHVPNKHLLKGGATVHQTSTPALVDLHARISPETLK